MHLKSAFVRECFSCLQHVFIQRSTIACIYTLQNKVFQSSSTLLVEHAYPLALVGNDTVTLMNLVE